MAGAAGDTAGKSVMNTRGGGGCCSMHGGSAAGACMAALAVLRSTRIGATGVNDADDFAHARQMALETIILMDGE